MPTRAADEFRRGGGVARFAEPPPCRDGATVARRAGDDGDDGGACTGWPVAVGSAADPDGVDGDAVVGFVVVAVASVGAAPEPFASTVAAISAAADADVGDGRAAGAIVASD